MADQVPLNGGHVARLAAALEDAFTLEGLQQLLWSGLDRGLSLELDSVVPVHGRTRHAICRDLALWARRDQRV